MAGTLTSAAASRGSFTQNGTGTLTSSGTPTFNADSSVTVDGTGTDRVQAPGSLISPTAGWGAFRLKFTNDYASDSSFGLLYWSDGSSNNIFELRYSHSTQTFRVTTVAGGVSDDAQSSNTFSYAANDTVTLILAWSGSQVKCSLNGSAFTTFSRAQSNPTGLQAVFDLFSEAGSGYFPGRCYWFVCGTGSLIDADAATINGFGNTDPNPDNLPGACTLAWPCTSSTYYTSLASDMTLASASRGTLT